MSNDFVSDETVDALIEHALVIREDNLAAVIAGLNNDRKRMEREFTDMVRAYSEKADELERCRVALCDAGKMPPGMTESKALAAALAPGDTTQPAVVVTAAMVERYCNAVAEYLGNLDEDQWIKDRADHVNAVRRVARIGLEAALAPGGSGETK